MDRANSLENILQRSLECGPDYRMANKKHETYAAELVLGTTEAYTPEVASGRMRQQSAVSPRPVTMGASLFSERCEVTVAWRRRTLLHKAQ